MAVQSGYRGLHDIVRASYAHFSYELVRSSEFSYYFYLNENTFIRLGYYGGHADVYIPHGKTGFFKILFYSDVNSLYPFVMQTRSMPGGKPQWHGNNLEDQKLSDLFGFIEAYVVCPNTIKKPFREKNTLIFPTG